MSDTRIWSYDGRRPLGTFDQLIEAMAHVLVEGRPWAFGVTRPMAPDFDLAVSANETVEFYKIILVPGYEPGQVKFATKQDQQNFAKITFEVD